MNWQEHCKQMDKAFERDFWQKPGDVKSFLHERDMKTLEFCIEHVEKIIKSVKISGNRVGSFELGEKVLEFANELLDEYKNKSISELHSLLSQIENA